MKAEILCVGTELLLGDIVNTNAAFLAKELAAMGIDLYYQSVVGDNVSRLSDAVKLALSRSDLLITTGGLGPTYDDITKETVAKYMNKKLVSDEYSLCKIKEFFYKTNREMTENNKKQAMIPEGATVFENKNGTAPGLAVSDNGKIAILLPGPPREMKYMFENEVRPFLQEKCDKTFVSDNVRLFGISESKVEDTIREMMKVYENPTIAPYAKNSEVLLRITASAKNAEDAHKKNEPVIKNIKEIFGSFVYGVNVENMQSAAVDALRIKGLRAATAESCTGGYLSKMITDVSGASDAFECGVCTYSNRMKEKLLGVNADTLKKFGAVSEEVAKEMAAGVRRLGGADIGIGITGIAGPNGGTEEKPVGLVYVSVSSDSYNETLKLLIGRGYDDERENIRYTSAMYALNLIMKAAEAK